MTDEELSGLPALERARQAAKLTEHHRALVGHFATVRTDAIAEARQTMTADEIAAELDVTRAAVNKLLRRRK